MRHASRGHVDALNMARWAAVETPLDESGIGEGVDRKRETVVVCADVADHFLIGPQVRILVMLDENPPRTSLPVCRSG